MRATTLLTAAALVAIACSPRPAHGPEVSPLALTTPAPGQPNPLIFLDGRRQPSDFNLAALRADDLARVEVVKGATAFRLYGLEGQNGVVLIFTKTAKPDR